MIELLYYIGEILQEGWWIPVVMGVIACIVMHFAPKEEEWESLDEYYNPNPFIKDSSAESEPKNNTNE